jgi:transmembrane sensor
MTESSEEGRTAREAADWLARLNSRSVSTEELNAFYEWRRQPENAAAYERGEKIWHGSRALGDDRDIAAAVREALERPRLRGDAGGPRISRRVLMAGAGALAAAAGASWFLMRSPARYETTIGQQLLVSLDDGSHLRLDTQSIAEVRFSESGRLVDLRGGQAFFEVQPDASRPFRVRTGSVEVLAVGTRFDVHKIGGSGARVILAEGRIEVTKAGEWNRTLATPGACITFAGTGEPQVAQVDAEAATSWTSGRLTFMNTPLREAIAEVNRYSRRQIELSAPDLGSLEVDGVFETGDPDSFVTALTALFPLQARPASPDRIVLIHT